MGLSVRLASTGTAATAATTTAVTTAASHPRQMTTSLVAVVRVSSTSSAFVLEPALVLTVALFLAVRALVEFVRLGSAVQPIRCMSALSGLESRI